jgi:predicted ATPase
MHFHFEKLGLLDRVDLELSDLTLICGENNTGKTYATYAVYGFLRSWRGILKSLVEPEIERLLKDNSEYRIDLMQMFEGKVNDYLRRMGKAYVRGLPRAFATDSSMFEHTICVPSSDLFVDLPSKTYQYSVQSGPSGKVLATLNKSAGSAMLEVLVADPEVLQRPFGGLTEFIAEAIADIVCAERTGVAIFRKELDMARTRMIKALHQVDSKEFKKNPFQTVFKAAMDADYAWPVEDNVEFIRQLEDIDKRTGKLAENNPELLLAFDAIIGGSYKVVKNQLFFQAKGAAKQRFTMNEASSSIRALLDVGFYLRCKAEVGDIFILDEPELNLHPKNQRAFARLVVRLVNAGVKVFITTHSDYLVKEINTLIMLHQRTSHTVAVQKQYGYEDDELIDPAHVRLYMTALVSVKSAGAARSSKIRTLKPAIIYPDRGIEVETFDDTIESMNAIQSEILFGGEL